MRESLAVEELLALLAERRPYMTSRPELVSRQLAGGALVFAERLLRGLQAVVRGGLPDVGGGLTRSIWECWCVGLYLVFNGQSAATHLGNYHAYRLGQLARMWPLEEGEEHPFADLPIQFDAPRVDFSYDAIAKIVEKELETRPGVPVKLRDARGYDMLYRFESTWSSHATFGAFSHYLRDRPDRGRVDVVELRENRVEPADGGIAFGAMWVAHLAYFVFREYGISSREIQSCLLNIITDANELAPAAPPPLAP